MLTTEQLLVPRYKVIANYPTSNMYFNVGDVLSWSDQYNSYLGGKDASLHKDTVEKYPHIFKMLEWWEERQPEEMPGYLQETEGGKIEKITRYFIDGNLPCFYTGEIEKKGRFKGNETPFNLRAMLPATEAEYLAQNEIGALAD